MSVATEWVQYENGRYTGYLAKPDRETDAPGAVIVLQEIWGVDGHIQDVTRRFAEAGYIAFAPDLYALNGQRPETLGFERVEETKRFLNSLPQGAWGNQEARQQALDALPAEPRERISGTLAAIFGGDRSGLAAPVAAAAACLRSGGAGTAAAERVAAVGFCLGGMLSAQLACRDPQLAGAVVFYGNAPSEGDIAGIACPVLGLYGELDRRITDAVPAFAEAMERSGKSFEYVVYEGAPHAFFNDTRPSYKEDAAQDAFRRTLAFLAERLG